METWNDAMASNRALWNELTPIHARAPWYRVEEFRAGENRLDPLVRAEVGDVAGKSLLHLQCHFGLDTLSWARLGARVTGVDLAEDAIALARSLGDELHLPATFVHSNVYDLPQVLDGEFDVVFTSWGVLCWLPDLTRWAQVIARYLKPGGAFYIVETHPFLHLFYNESDVTDLRVAYGYFNQTDPTYWPPGGDYADPEARLSNPAHEWNHSLGEIQNALIDVGLHVAFLREHTVLSWSYFPFMEQGEDGLWRMPPAYPTIPLSFSIKAIKPYCID